MEKNIDYKKICLDELETIIHEMKNDYIEVMLASVPSTAAMGRAYYLYRVQACLDMIVSCSDKSRLGDIEFARSQIEKTHSFTRDQMHSERRFCNAILSEKRKWEARIIRALDFLEIILRGETQLF